MSQDRATATLTREVLGAQRSDNKRDDPTRPFRRNRFRWRVMISAAATLGLVLLGMAPNVAAHAGDGIANAIHACVLQQVGVVRIVGGNGVCTSRETPEHWGIQGPQGVEGPAGPAGPPGSSAQVTGVVAYNASSTFTVPTGVTRLRVEAWGGGGGGAGGSGGGGPVPLPGAGGGGGGGGGYVHGVIDVIEGETLDIVVGAGGTAGAIGLPGGDGGETSLRRVGAVLLLAGGGTGGMTAAGSTPGTGGTGGRGDSNGGIMEAGDDGGNGSVEAPCCPMGTGEGGAGGGSVIGARHFPASAGGDGGRGSRAVEPAEAGQQGGPGYVIIQF